MLSTDADREALTRLTRLAQRREHAVGWLAAMAPALAKCLKLHAQVLADLERPDAAFAAFSQAVATIRPYFER